MPAEQSALARAYSSGSGSILPPLPVTVTPAAPVMAAMRIEGLSRPKHKSEMRWEHLRREPIPIPRMV
jgi:hypothetical protein